MHTPTERVGEFIHLTAEEQRLNAHSRLVPEPVINNSALEGAY